MDRETPQVFVISNQPLQTEAFVALVEKKGFPVSGGATIEDAFADDRLPSADVVIVDLPRGRPGQQFLRQVTAIAPGGRVVVISDDASSDAIDQALEAGAAAYLLKTAEPEDVALAIRQVVTTSAYGVVPLAAFVPVPGHANDVPPLTARELHILELLAEGHSNAELARILWVTEQTVKFHLKNIYRKLGVANRTEASRHALAGGRRHRGDAEQVSGAG